MCDAMKHYNVVQFSQHKHNGSTGEHTECRVVAHDTLYFYVSGLLHGVELRPCRSAIRRPENIYIYIYIHICDAMR